MLIFRWIVLLLMVGGLLCFAMYIGTGNQRWRDLGVRIVKWAVVAGADVHREAQQAADHQQQHDPAKNQHRSAFFFFTMRVPDRPSRPVPVARRRS